MPVGIALSGKKNSDVTLCFSGSICDETENVLLLKDKAVEAALDRVTPDSYSMSDRQSTVSSDSIGESYTQY